MGAALTPGDSCLDTGGPGLPDDRGDQHSGVYRLSADATNRWA